MMRRRFVSLLALPLCSACAKAPMPPAPATAARCAVPGVGSAQQPWRQVRATGFTFCVPAYWRPDGRGRAGVDATTWRGDAGTMTWGTGRGPVISRDVVTFVPVDRGTGMPRDPRDFVQPCSTPVTFTYDLDGATVSTTQFQCQGTFTTFGRTAEGELYLVGETRSAVGAAMQLAVARTIRLLPRTP